MHDSKSALAPPRPTRKDATYALRTKVSKIGHFQVAEATYQSMIHRSSMWGARKPHRGRPCLRVSDVVVSISAVFATPKSESISGWLQSRSAGAAQLAGRRPNHGAVTPFAKMHTKRAAGGVRQQASLATPRGEELLAQTRVLLRENCRVSRRLTLAFARVPPSESIQMYSAMMLPF